MEDIEEMDGEELFQLGRKYHFLDESGSDFDLAMKYYRMAADLGNPSAMNNIGYMFMNGEGVDASPEEAAK